jgi:GNAT superfamily N-acetyltransferase
MRALTIEIESPPLKSTLDVIDKGLDVYNAQFSPAEYEEFAVALKTDGGEVKGGIYAISWGQMLFIKWLWVDEVHRRGGHGRALMLAAEAEGRKRGCTAIWLDTFEFQARPFYEKIGFAVFGTLDYPAGFKRFFLQKPL